MNKPKYTSTYFGIIFLICGVVFSFFGLLGIGNILGEGITCIIISIVTMIMGHIQENKRGRILKIGQKQLGTVEKVSYEIGFNASGGNPYEIFYTYTIDYKVYHRKSYLLWENPNLSIGDKIEIYVDDKGNATMA